jgi:L-threonylcarbamoyladenylate synthase
LCGPGGTVALRISSHPAARALVRRCGVALTGTSANPSGQAPARTAAQVAAAFGTSVSAILDGGETPGGKPSTLVDLTTVPYRLIRGGAVSEAEIKAALGLL